MIIKKTVRDTPAPVERDRGDDRRFRLASGAVRRIVPKRRGSALQSTILTEMRKPQRGAGTIARGYCRLRNDGVAVLLSRWIGNPLRFNPSWELFDLRLWFDGAQELCECLLETHGPCPDAVPRGMPPRRRQRSAAPCP